MPPLSTKRFKALALLAVGLLAGWLYWPTVRLPLIYDTLLHIRIASGLNFATVWLPTEAFGFYRPMTFFPMLIIQQLFGSYPAWLLHGNNVVQHAVNAGLLAWLSWRLWPDWRRAVAAGTILATFPFAYQAVAVYGHNVHPAMAGLVLLGLHSYLTAISLKSGTQSYTEETQSFTERREKISVQSAQSVDKKIRKWLFFTWLLFGVMVLTHETAVLFGGFAALIQICAQPELLTQPRQLWRQPWRWFLLAGVAYLVIYQFLPISRAPQAAEVGRDLWLNGLYLLQAAVFPLAWFAHLLPNVSGQLVTLAGAGLVLAASGWLAWRRPAWRAPLLLAWGWWGATSLLLAITLPTDYLLRGPRLLYVGSVGVALLWTQLLAGLWSSPSLALPRKGREQAPSPEGRGLGRGLIWTAVLLFILLTSGQFVRTKLAEYAQLTEPVTILKQTPTLADEIVLVNLPQWLDVPPNTYAIGVEFVTMLGDYLFAEELVNANLPARHPTWAVSLPELQTSQAYAYGVQSQHEWPNTFNNHVRHYFVTSYLPAGPQTAHTGYIVPQQAQPPLPPPNPIAQLGEYLLTEATAQACNGRITVRLRWLEGRVSVAETTSVFVQVLAADGRLLTQADGPRLGIRPGLLSAPPDSLFYDLRQMTLPEGETAVPTTLLVGVYDFASGQRSPARDASGQPLPDNAWRIPIATCPN
ncbi:MAG: hypothetical protein R3D55_15390 [Chloroflexota bacterium]